MAVVNLTSGGLSGGYVKYLRRLIPLLRQDARISRLDVFLPEGISIPEAGAAATWPARDGANGFPELRRAIAAASPDVVFFPTARRIECGRPTVVMVRNMEPLTVPFAGNTWMESLRNVARARAARAACRKASRVIAVSRHVRRFVTGRWGLREDRVGLVYHGTDAPDAIAPIAPAGAGNWPPRFLFTAGSIRPARGLEDAIRGLAELRRTDRSLALIVAGRADAASQPYDRRMHRLAAELRVDDAIVWAGQLNEAEMAWAYERCAVFVVTSRAEACPNVALEALSHGAAIASTLQEPMPEFFTDAAVYYTPHDANGLVSRVAELLSEAPAAAAQRPAKARARAADFTWTGTADETVAQLSLAAATR